MHLTSIMIEGLCRFNQPSLLINLDRHSIVNVASDQSNGKTTLLKIIDFATKFLNGQTGLLEEYSTLFAYLDKPIFITSSVKHEGVQYSIHSGLTVVEDQFGNRKLLVTEESIMSKNMFKQRNEIIDEFLRDDMSMFSAYTKENPLFCYAVFEDTVLTEQDINSMPFGMIQMADKSIVNVEIKDLMCNIKRDSSCYYSQREQSVPFHSLETSMLLSPSTKRWLLIQARLCEVERTGGLFLIDDFDCRINNRIQDYIEEHVSQKDSNEHPITLVKTTQHGQKNEKTYFLA